MTEPVNPITARRLHNRKMMLIASAITGSVIGAFLIFHQFIVQWKIIEHDVGWNSDVTRNPAFAVQLYLEKQGIESEFRRSFAIFDNLGESGGRNTPGPNDTIVLFDSFGVINEDRYDKLAGWLYGGGVVVTSTHNPYNKGTDQDALFRELGIAVNEHYSAIELREGETKQEAERRAKANSFSLENLFSDLQDELEKSPRKKKKKEASAEDGDEREAVVANDNNDAEKNNGLDIPKKQEQAQAPNSVSPPSSQETEENTHSKKQKKDKRYQRVDHSQCPKLEAPTLLDFSSESKPLELHFGVGRLFEFAESGIEADGWIGKDDGVIFAQYFWGEGRVYVTANNRIWWNAHLACLDNAYLLNKLMNTNGKVWFVKNMEAPALSEAAWQFAPSAILALLLALILWLWYTSRRFGPIFAERDLSRRSFAEHLRAHARFLWRKQAHHRMLTSLRQNISTVLSRKLPNFDTMPDDEKLDHLEMLFKLDRTDLYRAFIKSGIDDKNELVKTVQCLKHIKDSL